MSLLVDIEKRFDNFTLSAAFKSDGITGLLGASGCGKTLTLKCIAGIERPDRGRIILNGMTLFDSERGINLPPQQRHVGYLFQSYALFPNMTVKQNILCGLYHEKEKKRKAERLSKTVAMMGIEALMSLCPHQLSGGQAQRVALARILVGEPQILMLDEPFSALDSHLRERLQMELHDLLREFGKDVLLVTHSREEAFRLCEELAVMENGHILVKKETKALFISPEHVAVARLTGCKNITEAHWLDEHHISVPTWGITLETEKIVPNNISSVGIGAHSFHAEEERNRNPIRILRQMEDPFEWVIEFRFAQQTEDSQPLWWRFPKSNGLRDVEELSVSPEDILLLTE